MEPSLLPMKTRIILAVLILMGGFGLMGGIMRYNFRNIDQAAARTESDFTTETFTIKKIDHIKETRDGQVVNDYFILYPEEEALALSFRQRWMTKNELPLQRKDIVDVKLLKDDLENYHKRRYNIIHFWATTIPIYQITKDEEIIYEVDITRPAWVETFQMENLLEYGIGGIFIVVIIRNSIKFLKKKLAGERIN